MFAVFDGHNGWETSAWLRENLLPAVTGALADLYSRFKDVKSSAADENPAPGDVERTLKATFQRLDDDIVHSAVEKVFATTSRHTATNLLAPAYAGSCALLAFYDSHTRFLHVALSGDSRAVLGRRVKDDEGEGYHYEVRELSVDQNGRNPAEESRLGVQHPGEHVIKNGRVLGWGVSRAFGDARWKWSPDVQRRLKEGYLGRSIPHDVKTPPYLIVEPEVTATEIQPGDFLIMASDGLWESLTSEEAVGLVGWWRDARSTLDSSSTTDTRTASPDKLPIEQGYEDNTSRDDITTIVVFFDN
ncbi:hypothetical protein PHLCEN_2v10960 [Hermanssonia centrifuga]|uniref:PPM-type phosphatase domain-containing protein n=1 Tax=Hermanssonia centrifuga TaxID=98765 RepID=A0A2R6NLG0_9APHY|nr:hypothetical protein PHLCEN_2v10960 [Hermanssonia centrifuga]